MAIKTSSRLITQRMLPQTRSTTRKHKKTYVAQHKGLLPPLGEADADGGEDSSL